MFLKTNMHWYRLVVTAFGSGFWQTTQDVHVCTACGDRTAQVPIFVIYFFTVGFRCILERKLVRKSCHEQDLASLSTLVKVAFSI